MLRLISKAYWGIQKHPVYLNMITSIIILVVGGLIVYRLTSQNQHSLIIECRNLGEKINKEFIPRDVSSYDPEFYYNPKLKKCFYCGGYRGDGYTVMTIIDAYTNRQIASSIMSLENRTSGEISEAGEFYRLRSLLFNKVKNPKKYEIDIIRKSIE